MSNEINKTTEAVRSLDLEENHDAAIARPEGQFMNNLSFQSNNSPEIFQLMTEAPQVDVKCSVDASLINESIDLYQVILKIHTEANLNNKKNNESKLAFRCQLEYCGLFTIRNLSKEQKEQALLIEAPTLLFPFARRIIATVTTDAGFPPLMLAPINFAAKYIEKNKDNLENMEAGVQAG